MNATEEMLSGFCDHTLRAEFEMHSAYDPNARTPAHIQVRCVLFKRNRRDVGDNDAFILVMMMMNK